MKRGAELVFIEAPEGGRWTGRLVNRSAIDRYNSRRAIYTATIRQLGEERFMATTQGNHVGSRRHTTYRTLNEAQAALINWARRRFYVEV